MSEILSRFSPIFHTNKEVKTPQVPSVNWRSLPVHAKLQDSQRALIMLRLVLQSILSIVPNMHRSTLLTPARLF